LEAEVRRGAPRRVFDLGCGNGAIAAELAGRGFDVSGVDPSDEGIAYAAAHYPHLHLRQGSAYDDLSGAYGKYPLVISLEVVEHVYAPRKYAHTVFSLLEPGGTAVLSTPYHGYLKNLALALSGRMDRHFTALWDHGHIKFWSRSTLRTLLHETGFSRVEFLRVGRIPPLAKSMIAVARK
jgi:2-polyprenyl-6-hydroxyphenyl methylase/3-demethylubiquinone-9 3-methyltransferase